MTNFAEPAQSADNRRQQSAVELLDETIDWGRLQKLHGEVGVKVFFQDGVIQGFCREMKDSRK